MNQENKLFKTAWHTVLALTLFEGLAFVGAGAPTGLGLAYAFILTAQVLTLHYSSKPEAGWPLRLALYIFFFGEIAKFIGLAFILYAAYAL